MPDRESAAVIEPWLRPAWRGAVFIFGFAKNDRRNIDGEDLQEFKSLALVFPELSNGQIAALIEDNELTEVSDDKTN